MSMHMIQQVRKPRLNASGSVSLGRNFEDALAVDRELKRIQFTGRRR